MLLICFSAQWLFLGHFGSLLGAFGGEVSWGIWGAAEGLLVSLPSPVDLVGFLAGQHFIAPKLNLPRLEIC